MDQDWKYTTEFFDDYKQRLANAYASSQEGDIDELYPAYVEKMKGAPDRSGWLTDEAREISKQAAAARETWARGLEGEQKKAYNTKAGRSLVARLFKHKTMMAMPPAIRDEYKKKLRIQGKLRNKLSRDLTHNALEALYKRKDGSLEAFLDAGHKSPAFLAANGMAQYHVNAWVRDKNGARFTGDYKDRRPPSRRVIHDYSTVAALMDPDLYNQENFKAIYHPRDTNFTTRRKNKAFDFSPQFTTI